MARCRQQSPYCFSTIKPHMFFVISTGEVKAWGALLTVCVSAHQPAFKVEVNSALSLCHLPVTASISFL